ncbi:MAG: rod shape-determining protein MreC [bacterium]
MYYYENRRKKGIYLWIIVLILIVTALNTPAIKRSKSLRAARALANNISFPFKYVFNAAYEVPISGVRNLFRLKGAQKENEQLKKEISEHKAKAVLFDELSRENEKLRSALYFRSNSLIPGLLPAEIIGRAGSNWFNVVEINRGAADRVASDSAVINDEGLVGRVFEVSKHSSKVLLITDPSSAVSVLDVETGDMGIAAGNSIGPLKIRYMSATAVVKAGDKIVTSGMSDIFPKGVIIGVTRSVNKKDYDIFQKVDIDPAVNFSRLDKVFVIAR